MSAILKQKLIDIANGFTKYGLWKGGGSGGSSALSEMSDVKFTDLKANDILKYNGSVWINDKNLHEYSTEEKIVGKWIDGKPIYEKTIIIEQYSVLNFNGNVVKISDNYGKLIDCHGTCIDKNGYEILLGANWSDFNIGIQIRNGYICFYNKYGTVDINLTIQYTKTTD